LKRWGAALHNVADTRTGIRFMTIEQVTRIKETLEQEWLKIPGVTGMDAGFAETQPGEPQKPAIRVYVEDRQDIIKRSVIPSEVEGAPVVIIERRFRLH
jgi:hypothetical protein